MGQVLRRVRDRQGASDNPRWGPPRCPRAPTRRPFTGTRQTSGGRASSRSSNRFLRAVQGSAMTLSPSTSRTSNAAKAMGLPGSIARLEDGLDALAAVAGHRLAIEDGRRDRPADLAQPRQPRQPDQLTAGAAEGVDGAMVAHVELRALAVELGLGAVARVREPTRVFQAGGEHRGDEGHGGSSIVATAPSRRRPYPNGHTCHGRPPRR